VISGNVVEWGDIAERFGGGISIYWYSSPRIINCTITENSANNGGGILVWMFSYPVISNCLITGNNANWGAGIGYYYSWSTSPVISNCLITGNHAYGNGGGIGCYSSSPEIVNCTITGNSAAGEGGAIHCRGHSSPKVTNCILWGDTAFQGPEIWIGTIDRPSNLTVAYSDVQGAESAAHVETGSILIWSDGNIDSDPLFVGGDDYHLNPLSPCIDAGYPEFSHEDECFPPSLGAGRNDMGAYGGLGGCGWICWDNDGDGYHDPECGGLDCDDWDPYTYPGAEELCDGLDNNCDETVPGVEIDYDGDGFAACEYDCDDSDPDTYPEALELCDFRDNDCDGVADEGPCRMIEVLALLGLASCLLQGEEPPPVVEGGGESGGCGCALYQSHVTSGLASSFLVYLVPAGFIGIYKRRLRKANRKRR